MSHACVKFFFSGFSFSYFNYGYFAMAKKDHLRLA